MKGVILAGGTGSRLFPLTQVINKHLLLVYNQPMIFYPIQTLILAGIRDILIILGGESIGDFVKLLGSGNSLGINLTYRCQDTAGGIAEALGLAEDFAGNEPVMVILGDNIIEDDLSSDVRDFLNSNARAGIFLKEVVDPGRFGIAEIANGQVVNIEEKPIVPKTNLAVTGIYFYQPEVFTVIKNIEPSYRGELEITDVNNRFIHDKSLQVYYLHGFWTDAGTFESLYLATSLVREAVLRMYGGLGDV